MKKIIISALLLVGGCAYGQDCDTSKWLKVPIPEGAMIKTPGKESVVFSRTNTQKTTHYSIEVRTLSKSEAVFVKGIAITLSDGSTIVRPKEIIHPSPHSDNERFSYEADFILKLEEISLLTSKRIVSFKFGKEVVSYINDETGDRLAQYFECLKLENQLQVPLKTN